MENITNNFTSTSLNSRDETYIKMGFYFRVYLAPFIELIGGINNFLIILMVDPFKFIVTKKLQGNKSSSSQIGENSTNSKSRAINLSKSATLYFTFIALSDTAVLWSSVFQRGWIRDVFNTDPTALSSVTCKIFQFFFNCFLLFSSW